MLLKNYGRLVLNIGIGPPKFLIFLKSFIEFELSSNENVKINLNFELYISNSNVKLDVLIKYD